MKKHLFILSALLSFSFLLPAQTLSWGKEVPKKKHETLTEVIGKIGDQTLIEFLDPDGNIARPKVKRDQYVLRLLDEQFSPLGEIDLVISYKGQKLHYDKSLIMDGKPFSLFSFQDFKRKKEIIYVFPIQLSPFEMEDTPIILGEIPIEKVSIFDRMEKTGSYNFRTALSENQRYLAITLSIKSEKKS